VCCHCGYWFLLDPETGPKPCATNVVLLPVVVGVVVVLVVSPKAFSFRNRSLLNFAYRLTTIFSHRVGFSS